MIKDYILEQYADTDDVLFADDYQRNCFQKSTDDYYNETFNTKDVK